MNVRVTQLLHTSFCICLYVKLFLCSTVKHFHSEKINNVVGYYMKSSSNGLKLLHFL